MTVLIASGVTARDRLEPHRQRMYDALEQQFRAVLLANPRRMAYILPRSGASRIFTTRAELHDMEAIVALSTLGRQRATGFLVNLYHHRGAVIADGIDRYASTDSTKTFSQLDRWKRSCAPATLIGFGRVATMNAVRAWRASGIRFPFVLKPVSGRRGEGVRLINNQAELETVVTDYFAGDVDEGEEGQELEPIMFQELIQRAYEYRVVLFDGQLVGIVRKNRRQGGFEREVQWGGGVFLPTEYPDRPVAYVREKCGHLTGLIGVDVMREQGTGTYVIIEENRSPGAWDEFMQVTGEDIAVHIAAALHRRIHGE